MLIRTNLPFYFGPFIILIWLIDGYLLLAGLRLVLGYIPSTAQSRFCAGLQLFTDPIPKALARFIESIKGRPVSQSISWFITLGIGVMLRYVLLWIVLST